MNDNQLLESYFLLKRELRELEYQHNYVKEHITELLDRRDTDYIQTPNYEIVRSWRKRENFDRNKIPIDIWNRYKTTVEYTVLNLKPR